MQYFDAKEYGKNIREVRKLKKITQEELAKAVGYSNERQIQRIEAGSSTSSIDKLVEISQALEVSTDRLLYGDRNSNIDNRIIGLLEDKTSEQQEFAFKMLKAIFDNKDLLVG